MTVRNVWSEAIEFMVRAQALREEGRADQAEGTLELALELLRTIDAPLETGNCWLLLGRFLWDRGEKEAAVEAFGFAVRTFAEGREQGGHARALLALGETLLWQKSFSAAAEWLEEAISALRSSNSPVGEASAWCCLGEARLGLRQFAMARKAFREAQRLAFRNNVVGLEARALTGLGWNDLATGAVPRAEAYATRALEAAYCVGDVEARGWALMLLAGTCWRAERCVMAWWAWRRASFFFRRSGCKNGYEVARAACARSPLLKALWDSATRWLRRQPRQLPPADREPLRGTGDREAPGGV